MTFADLKKAAYHGRPIPDGLSETERLQCIDARRIYAGYRSGEIDRTEAEPMLGKVQEYPRLIRLRLENGIQRILAPARVIFVSIAILGSQVYGRGLQGFSFPLGGCPFRWTVPAVVIGANRVRQVVGCLQPVSGICASRPLAWLLLSLTGTRYGSWSGGLALGAVPLL